jgi:hypothetical protein
VAVDDRSSPASEHEEILSNHSYNEADNRRLMERSPSWEELPDFAARGTEAAGTMSRKHVGQGHGQHSGRQRKITQVREKTLVCQAPVSVYRNYLDELLT